MAKGISFLLRLLEDFHVPSLSRYLRCTVAFNIVVVPPVFNGISFFHIAAEIAPPAWNFATGLCPDILFHLEPIVSCDRLSIPIFE